ncbi:MAG: alpha/beta hydrolase [Archangium sp.]|nr:alpha/beta hydrolase [Archangium sp.]MDP3156416.1 alpha/beta hydrolase [Archangium sp.]MDP3573138.1 alpha/beta hydrolase [Archangium sp.]
MRGLPSFVSSFVPERLKVWTRLTRELPPADRLIATTSDGQQLALWRVKPAGASKGAVLLLHGLGSNRFAFHWPGRSIADYLAGEGFDAYVAELRGAGHSCPELTSWTFHDYLEHDVPALLQRVKEESGQSQVHLVGHSMGGILAMCHGIVSGGEGLRSLTALGSALDYGIGVSGFGPIKRVQPVLERLTSLPWGVAMQVISPLLARISDPLAGFNFHPDNAEAAVVRAVYSNAFGAIPTALLSSLSTALGPGGLQSRGGEAFQARAATLKTPLLLMAASDDRQCPLLALEATAAATSAKVLRFGSRHGHRAEYGHFDLLLGKHAPEEVWPQVLQWLQISGRG